MNTETLIPLDMSDAIAMIKRQQQEIARLKMYQAVCHCGSLAMDHGLHDGHTAVPMEEPCPYVEQIATLTAENKRLGDALESIYAILKIGLTLRERDARSIAKSAILKEEKP